MKSRIQFKNLFLIIIVLFMFFNLFLNYSNYRKNRDDLKKEISDKLKRVSEMIKDTLEENFKRNYYLEEIFYEKAIVDFKTKNFFNRSKDYIIFDKNLKRVAGDLNIKLNTEEIIFLKDVYRAKIALLEFGTKKNGIYLLGYGDDKLYLTFYEIDEEIIKSLDTKNVLKTLLKNLNYENIDIYTKEKSILKIENSSKNSEIKEFNESIEVYDILNNENEIYNIKIGFDISKEKEDIRKNYYDFIFTIIIIIIITILISLYIIYQNRYIKNQNILKEKEKEIFMGTIAAGVAHEIRNPLNSINYSIEYLKKVSQNDRYMKYFSIVSKEIKRINLIIEEFLHLREGIKTEKEKKSLNEIVKESIEIFTLEMKEKNIEFHFLDKKEHILLLDSDKMKEVFVNIIKNSIEALDEKENKKIELIIDDKEIKIKDNGIGMNKIELDNIFNLYFTSKKTGNGIGMYRVKKILEAHEIDIVIQSKKSIGTEITLNL